MALFERQVKGVTALFIIIAVIPFTFFYHKNIKPAFIPPFLNQTPDAIVIEVISSRFVEEGIYFLPSGMSSEKLLEHFRRDMPGKANFPLETLTILTFEGHLPVPKITSSKIAASQRLALGLPVDINSATAEELMLISGIGPVLASRITEQREKYGPFIHLNQLTSIKGIKEKTMQKIAGKLCVDSI